MTLKQKDNKCKECGALVEATIAKKSYQKYEGVFCKACRDVIDAALENGIIINIPKTQGQQDTAGETIETHTNQSFNVKDQPDTCEILSASCAPKETLLDINTIKKYICENATDAEAFTFLRLCQARNLNPFLKEAYLIKYSKIGKAVIVVGKDAFTKRAEQNPNFDGFAAGIIVGCSEKDQPDSINCREGAFMSGDERLLGGWAKVYRKDHKYPITSKISLHEYIQKNNQTGAPNTQWSKMPATMIRKVALVQALRESFPSDLGGCYDSSETEVEL